MKTKTQTWEAAVVAFVLLISSAGVCLHAEEWAPLDGADALRDLVAGATAEIELKPGEVAVGQYRADGTATITAWGETYARTWEVVGDDRVCYSSLTETNCFTFERNLDVPGQFRALHVETGEIRIFRVTQTDPEVITADNGPGGEGGLGAPSASEVAAALSNPNTTMGTMSTLIDLIAYDGDLPDAGSQRAFRATFQPSLPYPLSDTTNLFVRPLIPIIFSQDVPTADGFESVGLNLGDIGFDASIARTLSGGYVVGGGLVGTLPTATDDALGLDQWLLGPEVLVAKVAKWGVLGLLVTHQWDVAGGDGTSITGGQYFYTINLKNGWQINGSPVYSYNHNASSGNAWTFPIAFGFAKTSILGGRPWKFNLQYWHYVVAPDTFGPNNQIRIGISPVVALPW
jgi:hypothetical protein